MRDQKNAAILGLLLAMCGASPALADAIDGHWCHTDGKRLHIAGPSIVTPGGKRMEGAYDRHHFSYLAPAGDLGAGQTISMALMGELAVQVQIGPGAPEIWNRCAPPLSEWHPPHPLNRTEHV